MRTGVTATQRGITLWQKVTIERLLRDDTDAVRELRHGDCIGGDADIHDIAANIEGYRIVIHPPSISSKRAFKQGHEVKTPLPYLDRNHAIVDAAQRLIAAPGETIEQLRSGTWATIRYAQRVRKPVTIVYPDGSTK